MITGASGVVGYPLHKQCIERGWDVTPVSRQCGNGAVLKWDLRQKPPMISEPGEVLLHTAPLWLLPGQLEALAKLGVGRVVCFSSTSVFTKSNSVVYGERALADALGRAESEVLEKASTAGIDVTVFRPTMIYGYGRDRNVNTIARFARKYGFFPLAGKASGKRQPLAAADAVMAVFAALSNPATLGKSYTLVGGEVLSYRDMVARIFNALHKPPRMISIPTRILELLLAVASYTGTGFNRAMAARMNQDLVFDVSAARLDFGFSAEKFLEHPDRDLRGI